MGVRCSTLLFGFPQGDDAPPAPVKGCCGRCCPEQVSGLVAFCPLAFQGLVTGGARSGHRHGSQGFSKARTLCLSKEGSASV